MDNHKTYRGYDSIFAERLRFLMKEHSTKQTDLAEYLGLTRQAISKYADGSALPNIENLQKICNFFEVSSDYMLGLSNSESLVEKERFCSDFTGLNSNSLTVLNSISKQKTEERVLIDLLNNILLNKNSLMTLSKYIMNCYYAYINKKFTKESISLNSQNTENIQFDYRTALYLGCDWFEEPLEDVVMTLCKEMENNNGNENK